MIDFRTFAYVIMAAAAALAAAAWGFSPASVFAQ
jgi:hypothetical protein